MKAIIFASVLLLASAASVQATEHFIDLELTPLGMDWRNASYNVSQFMMGFAIGAYDTPVEDLTHCINDTADITITIIRDFEPIMHGDAVQRAMALSDLLWHLVRDIPECLEGCGHIGNKTRSIIDITRALFRDFKDFHKVAASLLKHFVPASRDITSAALAMRRGDWKEGGLYIGKVFKIILDHDSSPETEQYVD